MAIKPILFNTEMVRAILDGRKTCTRRICKDANECTVPDMEFCNADRRTYAVHNFADKEHMEQLSMAERNCLICPGDILYVRETFAWCPCWDCGLDIEPGRCSNATAKIYKEGEYGCYMYRASCEDNEYPSADTWHPSIHMPKEAARIWLKVTDVRVERLQDITSEQISREGVEVEYPHVLNGEEKRYAFSTLWNSTVKKSDLDHYGWKANPWVWVIEFERCEKQEEI